jgi:hypothetical protein
VTDPALRYLPISRLNQETSESRSTISFNRDPRTGLITAPLALLRPLWPGSEDHEVVGEDAQDELALLSLVSAPSALSRGGACAG